MIEQVGVPEPYPPGGSDRVTSPRHHGGRFRKYVVLIAGLVGATLVGGGVIEGYYSYQEHHAHLVAIQQEHVSRTSMDVAQSGRDLSQDPRFLQAFRKPRHRSGIYL